MLIGNERKICIIEKGQKRKLVYYNVTNTSIFWKKRLMMKKIFRKFLKFTATTLEELNSIIQNDWGKNLTKLMDLFYMIYFVSIFILEVAMWSYFSRELQINLFS